MKRKRLGILTAGGDCPGLNAVLRAVARTAILRHGYEVIGFEDGYYGLVKNRFRPLDFRNTAGLITLGGTILGTSNKDDPFRWFDGGKNGTRPVDRSREALKTFAKHRLDGLVAIGGDGTMAIAGKLGALGARIVGVPKTIDNDLRGTDVTFGHNTAVTTAMEAIDKIHDTAAAHHRVMVIEVMGRYAGWIALSAGLSSGVEAILMPEIPFRMEQICRMVLARKDQGKRFSIVVVAEGARPRGGKPVVRQVVATSTDPIRLGGIGQYVAERIERDTGIETRVTILGHLQRGGSPSAFDRILASRFGVAAAELAARGEYGKMVGLKGTRIVPVEISEVAGKQKQVPRKDPMIVAARSLGVCFGD